MEKRDFLSFDGYLHLIVAVTISGLFLSSIEKMHLSSALKSKLAQFKSLEKSDYTINVLKFAYENWTLAG